MKSIFKMTAEDKKKGRESKHSKKSSSNKRSHKKSKRKMDNDQSSNFNGECAELKGNVFEVFSESKDTTQYEKTIKDIMQVYIAANFRHGGDIGWFLKHEKEFQFIRPSPPTSSTTTTRAQDSLEQDIYKEQIKG